ncbi:MAG: short chain dehydrogenase [Paenibacillaceae bacterium]|jgi:NAD(P)-dependent dehydrogenase (short-subunit alcohol dehydrogenase family)|nr:short chain dehydrogenase [Paenibacillaceae bacterium]
MAVYSESAADSPSGTRVALITGASSGFGMLTALELARKGIMTVATMRKPERAGELLKQAEAMGVAGQIQVLPLDVTDPISIREAVEETLRNYQRLDILVNNAGFAAGGFVEDVPMEAWRQQMETNFFGLIAVTQSVLPTMRRQQKGLIINISSVSGRVAFPGYGPYAASKFAVEGFTETLRHELAPLGIRVVLVEPGSYRTPIWGKGLAAMASPPDSPYRERLARIAQYSRRTAETAPDPVQVAELIGKLADTRSPRLRYTLGSGSRLAIWGRALLPWKWFEAIIDRATR